ncbi:hypothetical protein BDV26DRAFT_254466 [Aspergillus bertholletiae]|uniref:Uncharacterized protein n=1 Tax=Aspergillus bertholletiae TaxID=1226010 RepID=A0A5N7BK38_9EURO|nr:hypothetical protein BDV26DRAFT_254466 [Aspergillus bertholletiae]
MGLQPTRLCSKVAIGNLVCWEHETLLLHVEPTRYYCRPTRVPENLQGFIPLPHAYICRQLVQAVFALL